MRVQLIVSSFGSGTSAQFVGHARTTLGVIASAFPRPAMHQVIKDLQAKLQKIRQLDAEILEDHFDRINGIIYSLWRGELKIWEYSKQIKLDFRLVTPKEKQVLLKTREIPPGKVKTYAEIAKEAGIPRGARFVGNTLRKNPLAPLIPCHRVVSSNGKLGGYGFGVKTKEELLKREGALKKTRTQ